jgi:hypothetical protein
LVLLQACEGLLKICNECIRISDLDDHVIHVILDILVELALQIGLNSSLVSGVDILQPKLHRCVAVGAELGDERVLLLILFLECYLVVHQVAAKEAEKGTTSHGIDDLIYLRQSEGILAVVLVEVGVVDT